MLHPLDYQVSRRAMEEMDSKRRLVQRLAAEAEAAFARKKGQLASHGAIKLGRRLAPGEEELPEVPVVRCEGRKRPSLGSVGLRLEPEEEPLHFASATRSPEAKRLASARQQAQQARLPARQRMEVSSLEVDPKRPRVAAGAEKG